MQQIANSFQFSEDGQMRLFEESPIEFKKIPLRDYQEDVVSKVWWYLYELNLVSSLVFAPTGSGKTVIAGELMSRVVHEHRQRCLFVVHRERLLGQTKNTMLQKYGIKAAIVGRDSRAECNEAHILVGMLQTLQSIPEYRLPSHVGMIIFDEVHSTAHYKETRRLINHYSGGILAFSRCKVVGLTATPRRGKPTKEGYCWLFQSLVKAPDIAKLISFGHLASFRHFGWGGMIDPSQLETGESGEITDASAAKVCDEDFYQEVANRYLATCPDRQAIAFCANVQRAEQFAQFLNDMGIRAAAMSGKTENDERERIIKRFEAGEIWIICNPRLLIEGFDSPAPRAVLLASPVNLPANLIQMGGRGARLNKRFPNKTDCWILDFCENFKRNRLFMTSPFPIGFCPTGRKQPIDEEAGLKECPECHNLISVFKRVCDAVKTTQPQKPGDPLTGEICGYVFGGGSGSDDDGEDAIAEKPQFGELLSPLQQMQVNWYRSMLRRAYNGIKNPNYVNLKFSEKWGFMPPEDWGRFTAFPKYSKANYEAYKIYLERSIPHITEDALKRFLRQQFGRIEAPVEWWKIFSVSRDCQIAELVRSYAKIYKWFEGDQRAISLINEAFDQGRSEIETRLVLKN